MKYSPKAQTRMRPGPQTVLALAQRRDDQPIVGRIAAMMPDDAQPTGQHLHGVVVRHRHAGRQILQHARIDFPRRLQRIAGRDLCVCVVRIMQM